VDEDETGVSFIPHASNEVIVVTDMVVGPMGVNQKLVVNTLKGLEMKDLLSPLIHIIEVCKFAHVPIVTPGMHLGFEGDIAMGVHNGADMSQ
jgi:hypothetical protein